jgi:transposase
MVNRAKKLPTAERKNRAIELRRQGLSLTAIADKLGCSYAIIQRDVSSYLRRLDQQCLDNAAAIRAQEFEKLEKLSDHLDQQIFDEGQTGRVDSAIKVSESKRRLYALDVQPVRRSEVTHKKQVVVELIHTLRAHLAPATFAEVVSVLTSHENYELHGVITEGSGDAGIDPPAALIAGQRDQESTQSE